MPEKAGTKQKATEMTAAEYLATKRRVERDAQGKQRAAKDARDLAAAIARHQSISTRKDPA